MIAKIVQPALAFLLKDFYEALRSRRVLVVFVFVGILLVGASASIAVAMAAVSENSRPNPFEAWFKSADGVLVGAAFGLTPFLLPFAPILATRRLLQADRDRGIFRLSLTKPVPSWGVAAGKFAGLYGTLATYTALLSLAIVVTIQGVSGASLNGSFVSRFIVGNVLLVGLYLLLTLLVGTLSPPEFVSPIVILAWLGFNAIRSTGFVITARLVTILGADEAATFQPTFADIASFTGLYQGLLAGSVPADLGFIVAPNSGVIDAIPWALLAWFVGLFILYALTLARIPNR